MVPVRWLWEPRGNKLVKGAADKYRACISDFFATMLYSRHCIRRFIPTVWPSLLGIGSDMLACFSLQTRLVTSTRPHPVSYTGSRIVGWVDLLAPVLAQ